MMAVFDISVDVLGSNPKGDRQGTSRQLLKEEETFFLDVDWCAPSKVPIFLSPPLVKLKKKKKKRDKISFFCFFFNVIHQDL